jgi:hypothetical protein
MEHSAHDIQNTRFILWSLSQLKGRTLAVNIKMHQLLGILLALPVGPEFGLVWNRGQYVRVTLKFSRPVSV